MTTPAIVSADVFELRASPRSIWTFVELSAADGHTGTGEASLHHSQERLAGRLKTLAQEQSGASPSHFDPERETDIVEISARCAIDQALRDIEARRAGVAIHALYTQHPRPDVPVYANVNRRTRDRSPQGFAASAARACEAGFAAVKIAPFDGVEPGQSMIEAGPRLDAGFARIAAVRDAIGDSALLVDCHWRLSAEMGDVVVEETRPFRLHWLECPFQENPDWFDAIRRFRTLANAAGVLTAGGEDKTGKRGFAPLLERALYDVVMPDMKHVGGYDAFLSLVDAAARDGIIVSPHNPTGPICHAHSVQACAIAGAIPILEMQFDETPLFASIVEGALPLAQAGTVHCGSAPGLGVALRHDMLSAASGAAR